ncbi:MAG: GatB/YqeY domain-containing protein [Bradymonadaceae bacterium]
MSDEEPETVNQITSDMKAAMKEGRKEEVSTLRMLISSLNNAKIDKGGELSDDDVIEVLSTEAKQRRESIEAYREGGRDELVDKEQKELEVVNRYLPEQLSDDEIAEIVDEAIAETGAETKSDMGRVMGKVMPEVKGQAEGSKVRDIVMEKLA